MNVSNAIVPTSKPAISCDQALKIASTDAEGAYRDLSAYRIGISLDDGNWHVDYELKDEKLQGGGPHYVIDGGSGKIVSKRYEQ